MYLKDRMDSMREREKVEVTATISATESENIQKRRKTIDDTKTPSYTGKLQKN